jgi:hypothetical protein
MPEHRRKKRRKAQRRKNNLTFNPIHPHLPVEAGSQEARNFFEFAGEPDATPAPKKKGKAASDATDGREAIL